MHSLFVEHLRLLIALNDEHSNNAFILAFSEALNTPNHHDLSLSAIVKCLKKGKDFTKTITMPNLSINIIIKGRCDYIALMNGISIQTELNDHPLNQSLKLLGSKSSEYLIKHLIIAYLFNENNQDWLAIMQDAINGNLVDDYKVIESINAPPFAYNGQVLFDKANKETRRSVGKRWVIARVNDFQHANGHCTNGWLGIKFILFTHGVKKVFFKTSDDPKVVIDWIVNPLAKKDPSVDKMLFELRDTPGLMSNNAIKNILDDMLDSSSKNTLTFDCDNEVSVSVIKKRLSDWQQQSQQ